MGGGGAGARGFAEGGVAGVEDGALDGFGSFEEVADGEELDAGEFAAICAGRARRGVEAGFGGLAEHGFGWFLERDVDADLGLLALQDAHEVADLGDADVVAALDGEDDLAGRAGVVVMEVEASVDAAVGTLLDAFGGTRAAEAERPVLELILVLFGELSGPGHVGGFADDLVRLADFGTVGVVEAGLDEADGEVGDVDADPATVEFLGDLDGGAAAAEGIKDDVAFVGGGFEDALEEQFRLLGGIAQAFACLVDSAKHRYVVP